MKIIKENREDLIKLSDILEKGAFKLKQDLDNSTLVPYRIISDVESSLNYYIMLLKDHGEDLFRSPSLVQNEIKRVNNLIENLR